MFGLPAHDMTALHGDLGRGQAILHLKELEAAFILIKTDVWIYYDLFFY